MTHPHVLVYIFNELASIAAPNSKRSTLPFIKYSNNLFSIASLQQSLDRSKNDIDPHLPIKKKLSLNLYVAP